MGKIKYGSIYYKQFLQNADNVQRDVINFLIMFKCNLWEIEIWIQKFEELKELIENHKVCARSKVIYLQKCNKLTHEMGIFIKAQQSLEKFKLTVHQNS